MLAPQFTLRRLLTMVTQCAFVCLIVGLAAQGKIWAAAILVALFGLLLMLCVQGLMFGIIRVIGLAFARRSARRSTNMPLAGTPPSPQAGAM